MRVRIFLFITAFILCHPQLWPQTLTKQFPPATQGQTESNGAAATPGEGAMASASSGEEGLPSAPGYPIAEVVPALPAGVPVRLEYKQMEKHGDLYTLTGNVVIDYKSYVLHADKVTFDQVNSEAEAQGHVVLEGGPDDEIIHADHGTINLDKETGRFENVAGSIGTRVSPNRSRLVYTTANPFLFTGRIVIKNGPLQYQVIDGTMTSCRLPAPDWQIVSAFIDVSDGKARAKNSYFRLFGMPILYLPYATHPVDTEARQSGVLIPEIGDSSTKGYVFGDSFYWDINRSTDATFGTQYFSERGWSPSGEVRYRGRGQDFASFHFIALFDRGLPPTNINQGGSDTLFSGRRDFDQDDHTRVVATAEYLSSYVYREAFAESFALAVASQVTSSVFLTHQKAGFTESLDFERYQNFEGITQVGNTYDTPQVLIMHLPSLDFNVTDRSFEGTPVLWGLEASAAGLSRSEPGFKSGSVGRLDLYPHLTLPFHIAGWSFRPEAAARETFYTQSQTPTSSTPIEDKTSVNRSDVEASFQLRPPVLARDFTVPWLERLFGSDVRHTLEPEIEYRYVAGVNNFNSIPRFDPDDIVSNTNEVDYSLTQRLFLKHLHPKPCKTGNLPNPVNGAINVPAAYTECGGDTSEWITWRVEAAHFFDPTFGGAVTPFRRNVLTSTLDLTGVSFLGGPRHYSPILSRLKVRTSEHTDLEWDTDYDTKAGRLNASNLIADYRQGNIFGSMGYSTLQALNPTFTSDLSSQVTKYNLLRLLMGYGNPTKRGLSAGVNAGYDFTQDALQYGGIQTSYNWDCCGFNLEYRRLALGSVRNENEYTFSVTLAGVGSAGNLKHSERIF